MAAWDEINRETLIETDWFTVHRSDVGLPDGSVGRGWHWIEFPAPAVGVVAVRDDGAILLVNQFRFTTRTRDWEIPAGRLDPGETSAEAAARELREETGHRAAQLEPLGHFYPTNGSSNQEFVLYVARGVEQAGPIQDTNEVDDAQWFPREAVRAMLARNEILDGMSVSGLLWYFFKYG
jgi:8-oxo-dGTP pyrophosphatase MutT (NUDIX family)